MKKSKVSTVYSISTGDPYPLGATPLNGGVNFAIFSQHAENIELCLFDSQHQELARLSLPECTDQIWHGFIEGVTPGMLYGYRVYGPYAPIQGHRFNHHKLLLDPYAKAIEGSLSWSNSHLAYCQPNAFEMSLEDNARWMPKGKIIKSKVPPKPLKTPIAWSDMVIYELHVKGFTKLNTAIPEGLRGTYAGLASDSAIHYLKSLGVTSLELLPVHYFIDEPFLLKKQLVNYWGYNTLNYFIPHPAYSASGDIQEFKDMVSRLHEAGIEIILDVVFNHTCEGDQWGPTFSFRGIDNRAYYALLPENASLYINDTGCGNTLNVRHPRVLQLVMDSLRYWATELGVDGFRFDLATVLGRESHGFDAAGGFFDAVRQDPVLNTKKLIAEPWDVGPGGYQLGQFPPGWVEWNDQYRDVIRRFWRGEKGILPTFARRIHGSSDIFEYSGRKPYSSINFITSHDGFTLRDLVSFNERHNLANKEDNRDGHHSNFSFNYGCEGLNAPAEIESVRRKQQRNFLTTLLLSQGIPMLLGGDEMGRTQQGNNNAYCQDNSINWLNWTSSDDLQGMLFEFVKSLIAIRNEFPLLRSRFYIHKPEEQLIAADYNIHWFNQFAEPMSELNWNDPEAQVMGWMLESVVNVGCVHCIFWVFNASADDITFNLPEGWTWVVLVDTALESGCPPVRELLDEPAVALTQVSTKVMYGMSKSCNWGVDAVFETHLN